MPSGRTVAGLVSFALVAVLCLGACGGGGEQEDASSSGATGGAGGDAATSAPASGLVAAERIEACAGIDAAAAAEILGVAAADLTEFIGLEAETPTLRTCGFRGRQNPMMAVGFYLQTLSSVEEAVARMESERENLRMAAGMIGAVTKDADEQAPVQPIDGLGDEAYGTPVNNSLNMRVGNVIVQVVAPEDTDVKRRVAERIVAGLR